MARRKKGYRGDDNLARLLREAGGEAGVRIEISELRALAAGVAASALAPGSDGWLELAGLDGATGELAEQLRALRAGLAPAPRRGRPSDYNRRLRALQRELGREGLHGFVVGHGDAHQNENLPPGEERLAWLTGFTGSAGLALVLRDRAALWVDGRYTLQVREEIDTERIEPRAQGEDGPADWAAGHLAGGGRRPHIAYDPWLHSASWVTETRRRMAAQGLDLVPAPDNLVDRVWRDRPPAPISPVRIHPTRHAGLRFEQKCADIARDLLAAGCDAAVLSRPDSIAWLLNIRGADVPYTPLSLSFAVIHDDGRVDWFLDRRKLTGEVHHHLGTRVQAHDIADLGAALDRLGQNGARLRYEPASCPAYVAGRLKRAGAQLKSGMDPCTLPKARKNATELDGMRAAHERDGLAMVRFLAWLEAEAPAGGVSESAAAAHLHALRAEDPLFRGDSFATISGAGAHGAIVHYRVDADSDRELAPGELYLIDSGGQYLDGTTDVTRTLVIGRPRRGMRAHYSRVLKGHIAVDRARFPKGTTGAQLDPLARAALWQAGLDFAHGTGHGVGCHLGVHEGPQGISSRNGQALEPGMILSNEPGYYRAGAYGIRLENLIAVREAEIEGAEQATLEFETLTLAPFSRRLIDTSLLTAEEIAWIDDYHRRVRQTLRPRLEASTAPDAEWALKWLKEATRPLRPKGPAPNSQSPDSPSQDSQSPDSPSQDSPSHGGRALEGRGPESQARADTPPPIR